MVYQVFILQEIDMPQTQQAITGVVVTRLAIIRAN